MMTARLASTYGGVTGLLIGMAIVLTYDLPLTDSFYRLLALTACGAWMGGILAWLDQLLPEQNEQESSETEQ